MEQHRQDIRNVLAQFRQQVHDEMDERLKEIEQQLEVLLTAMANDSSAPGQFAHLSAPPTMTAVQEEASTVATDVANEVLETAFAEAEEKLGEQIDERIVSEMKASRRSFRKEFERLRSSIERTNLVWSMLVVVGGWLTWYGAWGIIGAIPFLSEPVIALVVGILFLLVTGAMYRKLIG